MAILGKELLHNWAAALACTLLALLAPSCGQQVSVLDSLQDSEVSSPVHDPAGREASGLLSAVTGTVDTVVSTVDGLLAPQSGPVTITVSGLNATVQSSQSLRKVEVYLENGSKVTSDKGGYKYTYKSGGSPVWDVFVETSRGYTQWYRARSNNVAFALSGSSIKISSTYAMKKVLVYGQDGSETQFSSGSNQGFVRTFSTATGSPVWDACVETEMGSRWYLDRSPRILFTASGASATVSSTFRLSEVMLITADGFMHKFTSRKFVDSFTCPDGGEIVEGYARAEQGQRWYRGGDARIDITVEPTSVTVRSTRSLSEVWLLDSNGDKYVYSGLSGLRGSFVSPSAFPLVDAYVRTELGSKWYMDNANPPVSFDVAGASATVSSPLGDLSSVYVYTDLGLRLYVHSDGYSASITAPAGHLIVEACAKSGRGGKWFLDNKRWYQDVDGAWFQDPDRCWYQDAYGKWYQDTDSTVVQAESTTVSAY